MFLLLCFYLKSATFNEIVFSDWILGMLLYMSVWVFSVATVFPVTKMYSKNYKLWKQQVKPSLK